MKVSILIGTRNRYHPVLRCIKSILEQDYPHIELLVLDDGSTAYNLCAIIKGEFADPRLQCIRSERSLGVAGGRNLLMKQATGDVFCVIDDDAYLAETNSITKIVEYLTEHTEVGILSFKILDYGQGRVNLLVPFSRRSLKQEPELAESRHKVSYFLGGFHAIRKSVIEECGDYYEGLFFGEEELDLSYRAIEGGYHIHYVPDISAHHYPEPSVVGDKVRRNSNELYHHMRNRFYLAYKYLPLWNIPVYLFIWVTFYGIKALKEMAIKEYVTGIIDGIARLSTIKRTPLDAQAVIYLKQYHGRIWY